MINVSETAAFKINELLSEENKAGSGLRVFVQGGGCSGFQYGLMIEENGEGAGDQVYESNGVERVVVPRHGAGARRGGGSVRSACATWAGPRSISWIPSPVAASRSRTRTPSRPAAAASRSRSNK